MDPIFFATTNEGKVKSLQKALEGSNVQIVMTGIPVPEPRSDDVSEIAVHKAQYAAQHLERSCIVQDGGFYIPVLNGFPNAYAKFATETIGLEGILRLVDGKCRKAEFRDALVYIDTVAHVQKVFTSVTRGSIAYGVYHDLKPWNWGPLHQIFIPEETNKTFAAMSENEMTEWRLQRAEKTCTSQFASWFKEEFCNV